MKHVHLIAALLFAATAIAQPTYKPAASRTLLRAGHVLDVHTGKETSAETIIVEGDRITAIAPTASTPEKPTPFSPASSTSTPTSPALPTSTPTSSSR
jgi:hypothetical protein